MFGLSEIAILLIVLILVLAARKLPDLVRSAGKSARILKSETQALKSDDLPPPPATYRVHGPTDDGNGGGGRTGA